MRFLIWFDRIVSLLLGALVALLMLMTFVDVMLRELFDSPLIFAPELTVVFLAALVYAGMAIVSARDEHITISLFENLFKGRAQRLKKAIIALMLAFLSGALAWLLWVHGGKLGVEHWLYLGLNKYWVAYGMSVLSIWTAIVFLFRAWINFRGIEPDFDGHTKLSSSSGS